ncbi:MAG: PRC-barrel domain containing protein [Alphaproteobacteria bacterium]|nr:PRC-barrel domain containing protein [Alphaproteobacteria bacterium]
MIRPFTFMISTAIFSVALIDQALPQGSPEMLMLHSEPNRVATTGYLISRIVGSTVVNEFGEDVGTVHDLIVTTNEKEPFAILSVGGFLNLGIRYVVVPYTVLRVEHRKMIFRGASKESLKRLPDFNYSTKNER